MKILSDQQINAIVNCTLKDPFSVLGMHREPKGISVRVFYPDAREIEVCNLNTSKSLGKMDKINENGLFTILFPTRKKFFKYSLKIMRDYANEENIIDPYSFLPIMNETDRYLLNEGNYHHVYEQLGSHVCDIEGINGTVFAVWAPNAKRVSLVGNFNNWDGRCHPMRLLGNSGIWELFVPRINEGEVYKFEVKQGGAGEVVLKTDPCGYSQEPFPHHGSIICNIDTFEWSDKKWIEERVKSDLLNRPLSIYEVHLGSWRKTGSDEDGDYLHYRDIAKQLADYVIENGFTHIELLPVQEHPYVPSWGYQVGGFYAVNHRFGTPSDFQYMVDYMHSRGIGVILDWVSGHFPKDMYGLVQFDGTCLYEHQDPREGEHEDWGTLIFNHGRHEVRNFLTSNALFWLDKFHIDGLRVDAVASMLYRNYSRKDGAWLPNKYGGVENLEAVEFLQSVNHLIHDKYPGVFTIAEESTSWPNVSRSTSSGGLGFTYKWNMGWMHDILNYFSKDPIYRKDHHDQLTFGLWYAFTENFILVLSHDEVVHGKRSLLEKMPGDDWQKFANLRSLLSYMYGHPGKKLIFQGGEFGMRNEWYEKRSIDWHLVEEGDAAFHHQGLMKMMCDLNRIYKDESALWECDFTHDGFSWIDIEDSDNSVVSFIRHGKEWHNFLVFVCNFTPVVRKCYQVGVPHGGFYMEIFNSDIQEYGGAGYGNLGGVNANMESWQNRPYSISITLPPLSVTIFKWKR